MASVWVVLKIRRFKAQIGLLPCIRDEVLARITVRPSARWWVSLPPLLGTLICGGIEIASFTLGLAAEGVTDRSTIQLLEMLRNGGRRETICH